MGSGAVAMSAEKVVTEKSFDEFHLYTLGNPVTLRDKETKQVEFVRATGVKAERIYIFEGEGHYRRGVPSSGKVQVFREFKNSEANKLGIAPKNETIRVLVGNSFDLVGERVMKSSREDGSNRVATQTFEIKVRNRKKEAVEIRVIEHANHGGEWTLTAQSQDHKKTDAQTFEFRVPLRPDEEKTVTYTIRYTW
jgi:hypothetical protein